MAFVLDPSVAAAWFLPDEFSALADRLLEDISNRKPVVPSLFRHELRNLLLVAEPSIGGGTSKPHRGKRRRRSAEAPRDFATPGAGAGDNSIVVDLARKHGLSGYDAAYLALALVEGLPLATFDRKLVRAAAIENVSVIGPL